MGKITVRDMSCDDLPQVHAIESCFNDTPWSMNSFSYELGNDHSVMKVAVCNSHVIGYICMRSLLDVTHVLKIAVVHRFRRKGIGLRLMTTALQEHLHKDSKVKNVTLEVRVSNTAAINLYKKAGFHNTGTRKDFYRNPSEDALIMQFDVLSDKDS